MMPISFLLQQQDQEEVPDKVAKDPPRGDDPAPEVEVERSLVPDLSPLSPPPPPSAPASADTPGPSHSAQHSPEHVHVTSRELAGVMDVVCSLATTQASMDQRLALAEATLEHCHTMLRQIMSHLGLPPEPTHCDEPIAAASLDMLELQQQLRIHHPRESEVVTLLSLTFLSLWHVYTLVGRKS